MAVFFPHDSGVLHRKGKLDPDLFCSLELNSEKTFSGGANTIMKAIDPATFILKMGTRTYDLEDRLVDYTCRMIDVTESLPKTRSGNYMAGQLIRSCHSPAFNYGEAQAAESPDDFIHKLRIVLKELKECRTSLKIITKKGYITPITKLQPIYKETEELIAIIGKSISTAEKNKNDKRKP